MRLPPHGEVEILSQAPQSHAFQGHERPVAGSLSFVSPSILLTRSHGQKPDTVSVSFQCQLLT